MRARSTGRRGRHVPATWSGVESCSNSTLASNSITTMSWSTAFKRCKSTLANFDCSRAEPTACNLPVVDDSYWPEAVTHAGNVNVLPEASTLFAGERSVVSY